MPMLGDTGRPRFEDESTARTIRLNQRVRELTFYSVSEGDFRLITGGNRRIAVFSSLGSILGTASASIWIGAALQGEIPANAELLVRFLPWIMVVLGGVCFVIAGVEWGSRNADVQRIREESKESATLS